MSCNWLVQSTDQNTVERRRVKWCDGSRSTINNGRVIANHCKASCGRCDNECEDNKYFRLMVGGGEKEVGCDWIEASNGGVEETATRMAHRCDKVAYPNKYVGDHCRKTCGLCNPRDENGGGEHPQLFLSRIFFAVLFSQNSLLVMMLRRENNRRVRSGRYWEIPLVCKACIFEKQRRYVQ